MDDLKLYGKFSKEIVSPIRTVFVLSEDMRKKFGIKKCSVVIIKIGKVASSDVKQLPKRESIKNVDADGHRYLGMLDINQICEQQTKVLIQKEYFAEDNEDP